MVDQPLLNNRYLIEKTLGVGGMAVVYLARDLMLERPVAIKLLRQDFSRDRAFRERFHQEAKAAANLSHPNIVTVHDFGLDNDRLFIVMEYLPGEDLKSYLNENPGLSIEKALGIMVQACAGVGYAHRANLVHCDIKPHNILITPDLRVKVTDFGIARALSTILPEEKNEIVWGSPQYFSPEQASGLAPSPASDVYSLGIILYELLTGHLPFNAATPSELARLHREALPPSPRAYNPLIPVNLEQIVSKVLSKEPSARYRTADQFGRVLENFEQYVYTQPQKDDAETIATPIHPSQPRQTLVNVTPLHEDHAFDIDWITIGLSLLAVLVVGGLIPFWLAIWFYFNPVAR